MTLSYQLNDNDKAAVFVHTDLLVIPPQPFTLKTLTSDLKRGKSLITKHSSEIKLRIFLCVVNAQLG